MSFFKKYKMKKKEGHDNKAVISYYATMVNNIHNRPMPMYELCQLSGMAKSIKEIDV